MSYLDNIQPTIEAYLQEQQDNKLRDIINTYCNGEADKVAKIVAIVNRTTLVLQQWGLVHTMANLNDAVSMLAEQGNNIEEYRSFISWLREDTIKVGRN